MILLRGARRTLPALGAWLILLGVPPAAGEGVNLLWNDCGVGPTAVSHLKFACDTNEGSRILVGSFVTTADLSHLVSLEATLVLRAESCPLPEWWRFRTAGVCRSMALTVSSQPPPLGSSCDAAIPEPTVAGFGYTYPYGSFAESRIQLVAAVPADQPRFVAGGTEHLAFHLALTNENTVGAGACGGCSVGVCISLTDLLLIEHDGTTTTTTRPNTPLVSSTAVWQRAPVCCGIICDPPPSPDCTTRATGRSWGAIKSLFR